MWCHVTEGGQVKLEASNVMVGNKKVQGCVSHPQLPVIALILEQANEFEEH
jgi:hypothetical protein